MATLLDNLNIRKAAKGITPIKVGITRIMAKVAMRYDEATLSTKQIVEFIIVNVVYCESFHHA